MITFSIEHAKINQTNKLHKEVENLNSKLNGISFNGGFLKFDFKEEINEDEKNEILSLLSSFVDTDVINNILKTKTIPARIFGQGLIDNYIAESSSLGILQSGLTSHVRKASSEVINSLLCGSLYEAIDEIKLIPIEDKDEIFLSDARLLILVNKIEKYLNIPLSENLE